MADPSTIRNGPRASVRTQILIAALLPAVVLLGAVLVVGAQTSGDAVQAESEAALVVRKVDELDRFLGAVLTERRVMALGDGGALAAATAESDAAGATVGTLAGAGSPELQRSIALLREAVDALPAARQAAGTAADGHGVYEAFESVVEPATSALVGSTVGRGALSGSDAGLAATFDASADALTAATWTDDATLLAVTAGGRLGDEAYPEYVLHSSGLRLFADAAVPGLAGPDRERADALIASPEWRRLAADARAVTAAGPGTPAAPVEDADAEQPAPPADAVVPDDYADAGQAVAAAVSDIAFGAARDAAARQAARASAAVDAITIAMLVAIALAVFTIVVAVRVSGRLVRRLDGLRLATLETADQLPTVLERLRQGEEVDLDGVTGTLDEGTDEIGELAAAVDVARRAAVRAAADEARTRAGANAVFLNIAHRSQAIVHRQLQVLDEAERMEHNSDQLARLFQLDHLTTRERRNAENLIIMGGQQPRRRWRRPVSMGEVVRSAVSESEQYTRITLGDVPDVAVQGAAVGDLIHLLAELVDNATSFSPPQCSIDVTASTVGRGVVVEVRDRGLGIEPEIRERLNATLADPPDLSLMTLSEDSRLGLYVVARLAHRHGVRVTLAESPYGGVMAIVLVPDAVLVDEEEPAADTSDDPATRAPAAGPEPAALPERTPGAAEPTPAEPAASTAPAPTTAAPRTAAPTAPTPRHQAPEPAPAGYTDLPDLPDLPELPVLTAEDDPTDDAPVDDPDEAPLPERRPQAHLARELQEAPDALAGELDDEPPVERSRAAMAALQRSSRVGRAGAPPSRNGTRP